MPRAPLAACALAAALAGCAQLTTPFDTYIPLITQFGVYKLDINQGNYISQDMVDKLKAGQTKAQVRTALGTPLITSAFRDNRWDYVYEFQREGRVREHRQFTVYFKDDLLARWEGDEMPKSVQELNRDRRHAQPARGPVRPGRGHRRQDHRHVQEGGRSHRAAHALMAASSTMAAPECEQVP